MVAISTDDIGFAAEILRVEEMDMRLLLLDIDDCEKRPETTDDDGEIDRGVEMSELDALVFVLYEAMAYVSGGGRKAEVQGARVRSMNDNSGWAW